MKISVITVCFNAEKYIEKTIKSVLNQNYPYLEYIILDGGSTDSTVEIIKKYSDKIAYFHSKKDNGQYHALDEGLRMATGEVVCWLNADDLFMPWTLSTVSETFQSFPQVKWLTGLPGFINEKNQLTALRSEPTAYSRKAIARGWHSEYLYGNIQQESTFWRNELYKESGGLDLELKYAADFKLWKNFAEHADLFQILVPISSFRRLDGIQISSVHKQEYQNEVANASSYSFLAKLLIKINMKSYIFRSIFKMITLKKGQFIAYSKYQKKWKKFSLITSVSNSSFSNLLAEYFLKYRK